MDDWIGILFFVGIAALVVGGIFVSFYFERKRREKIEEIADQMGLSYLKDGDSELQNRLAPFKLFQQGRSRKMNNLIHGDSGEVKLAIFDYRYTTGSGKNSQTHNQSVASIQSPDLECPDFRMRPENFFDKIGGALGFQDIDFESHPKFSQMFVLQGENEQMLREYFTPKLIEFFETKKGICVEAHADTIFFYRSGKRVKPDDLKELLTEAYEVYGQLLERE